MNVQPITLEGPHVRLEPLSQAHLDGLCAAGLDPDIWKLIPVNVTTRAEMAGLLAAALARQEAGAELPFATIHGASGQVAGSTRFMNIDRHNRAVEIGWTWLGKPWQRTVVNTEAKYLMLCHAFETLGCIRVELKTDAINHRSRAAIERLGAQQEGILRQHRITWTGRLRDTVYYSILDREWPRVKDGLEAKLAERGA